MTREEKIHLLFGRFRKLAIEFFPEENEEIDFLLGVFDHKNEKQVFATTGCIRCCLEAMETYLDEHDIGHIGAHPDLITDKVH